MGRRTRIAEGIYADAYGLAATVKVRGVQREQRFHADTDLAVLQAWRARTRADLLEARLDHADDPVPRTAATFGRDVERYLKTIAHRVSFKADRCHLSAWLPTFRHVSRHHIKPPAVQAVIQQWEREQVSAGTIRHRVRVLRSLYKALDRRYAKPPLTDVVWPKPAAPHPVAVPWAIVQKVAKSLEQGKVGMKRHGRTRTRAKTHYPDPVKGHARFLVLATTGQRPAQVMRAERSDVDLERGIWFVRSAKGGTPIPFPLDDQSIHAWQTFIAADAWGAFDTTDFARLLRRHGWPTGVRPYTLRHTLAIDMLLGGADLGDVQGAMGHRQIDTTRTNYAPMLLVRLRKALKLKRRGALT